MKISNLVTMITYDLQDIYQRLHSLRADPSLVTINSTLPLLDDLQDILTLYQHIKSSALYEPLPAEHHQEIIRFTELYFQTIAMLKRCISSLKRRDLPKYSAQLDIFTTSIVPYLKEEYQYLQHLLPQQFSAQQLEQLACRYEQLKHAGFHSASDNTNLYGCCDAATQYHSVYA
jgi:hypothetical protein